jgi:hypothetical protein
MLQRKAALYDRLAAGTEAPRASMLVRFDKRNASHNYDDDVGDGAESSSSEEEFAEDAQRRRRARVREKYADDQPLFERDAPRSSHQRNSDRHDDGTTWQGDRYESARSDDDSDVDRTADPRDAPSLTARLSADTLDWLADGAAARGTDVNISDAASGRAATTRRSQLVVTRRRQLADRNERLRKRQAR